VTGMDLANYLRKVASDFDKDKNFVRAGRQLHIKEVHLQRTGKPEAVKMLKRARRLFE